MMKAFSWSSGRRERLRRSKCTYPSNADICVRLTGSASISVAKCRFSLPMIVSKIRPLIKSCKLYHHMNFGELGVNIHGNSSDQLPCLALSVWKHQCEPE